MTETEKIDVILGDLTSLKTDAIVCAGDCSCSFGGGVAADIKKVEDDEVIEKIKNEAPLSIGEGVIVRAKYLPSRFLIHSPTVVEPGGKSSISYISKALKKALNYANDFCLESLAVPLLGAGSGGVCEEKSLETIISYVKDKNINKHIIIVCHNSKIKEMIREKLCRY